MIDVRSDSSVMTRPSHRACHPPLVPRQSCFGILWFKAVINGSHKMGVLFQCQMHRLPLSDAWEIVFVFGSMMNYIKFELVSPNFWIISRQFCWVVLFQKKCLCITKSIYLKVYFNFIYVFHVDICCLFLHVIDFIFQVCKRLLWVRLLSMQLCMYDSNCKHFNVLCLVSLLLILLLCSWS